MAGGRVTQCLTLNAIQGLGSQKSAAMGLSPLYKYMGLGPPSIYASVAQWRYAICGLGPLQIWATVGVAPQ